MYVFGTIISNAVRHPDPDQEECATSSMACDKESTHLTAFTRLGWGDTVTYL